MLCYGVFSFFSNFFSHFIGINAIKSLANQKRLNNAEGVNAGVCVCDARTRDEKCYVKKSNVCEYDAVQCKNARNFRLSTDAIGCCGFSPFTFC